MHKRYFTFTLILTLHLTCPAQNIYNKELLDTLHEIGATNTISAYFAKFYYNAIQQTNQYAVSKPENVKRFIFGFESSFGHIFCAAHRNYMAHQHITLSWQDYYRCDTLNEIQYQFMGMNAHINGDMHKGLIEKYSYDTLKKYKRELISFQKALNVFFDSIYITTYKYKWLRKLHHLSFGMDKWLGRRMVLHWRKRQINLALLYYRNPAHYERRLNSVQRIMRRWDERAIRFFK